KAVMADTEATQEQVNTAWDNLLEGIWGLGLVQGDKTLLEQLITKADGMMAEADKYVETNWQQLVDALAAAKDVAADGDAMDEDIQPVAEALLNAILAQRFKADKSILEDLIGQAEGMDLSGYTAESVATFRTALATAQAVMADATLSEDDQKTVDKAVAALTAAMNGLTAQGETQPSDKPETTDKPQATQKPDSEGGSVQTGDQANVVLPAAVTLLALVGLMFVVSFGTKKRG
ncbi:FIVAR domain-containing protein, partial [Pseudoflavonifractor capillosus]|nr:FIVAR domain-containing protein [Pseudoflavonifractor capillosus]